MSETRPQQLPQPPISDSQFAQKFNLSGKEEELQALRKKLNLDGALGGQDGLTPWEYAKAVLVYREDNYAAYKQAMDGLVTAFGSDEQVSKNFLNNVEGMRGKFVALFSAHKIDAASYHAYPHGVEMSGDPGSFSAKFYTQQVQAGQCSQFEASLWQAMANAIGAAHDIVQGKGAPRNERETAEIFIDEMRKMIEKFKSTSNLSAQQIKALDEFSKTAIPFLAQECLINGTFLLFASGKRDFANVLHQIHEVISPQKPEFAGDKRIAAASMSIALSDTRRSEMHHVLDKQALLNSIPDKLIDPLEKVLRMAGLLGENENIRQLQEERNQEKLRAIEGFLLRVGQNIRMTTELSRVFAGDDAAKKEVAESRLGILAQSRVAGNVESIQPDLAKHFMPFLNSIGGPFGESAFAKALGEIDQNELRQMSQSQGIESMMEGMDLTGWQQHDGALQKLHNACKDLPEAEQKEIARVLLFVAARPPGHKVSREIFQAMENELSQLESKAKWGGGTPEEKKILEGQINKLKIDITEIKNANPELAHFVRETVQQEQATKPEHGPVPRQFSA